MICNNTPIEKHGDIYVKREDLACLPPGPPFAKVRGLFSHLMKLRSEGISVVGYVETAISEAGWGVAWLAKELDMKAVIFNPVYKTNQPVLDFHRIKWVEFGAEIRDIKAGMAKVGYNISKKLLIEEFGSNAIMLPLGLPFSETIDEVAKEFQRTYDDRFQSIVICVGSGTMAAGVLKGMRKVNCKIPLYGILCRQSKQLFKKRRMIVGKAGYFFEEPVFYLIDLGYNYTDKVEVDCPFPSNCYYDKKAWLWLKQNVDKIEKPVLFWNIGA